MMERRRGGRPATGRDPVVTVRLPGDMIDRISIWAAINNTSQSDAIRSLINAGCKSLVIKAGKRSQTRYWDNLRLLVEAKTVAEKDHDE